MNRLTEISFIFINVILICISVYLNFIEPASHYSDYTLPDISIRLIWLIILCISSYSLIHTAIDYYRSLHNRSEEKDDDK